MRFYTIFCGAMLAITAGAACSPAAELLVGVQPSDGVTMLAKRFSVAAGTTILGAEFRNNDARVVFPEIILVRNVTGAIGEGTVVARVTNASEVAGGSVQVTWSQPVVAEAGDYFVAVKLPAGDGKQGAGNGPALGAVDVTTPSGSFLTAGPNGELCPISVDLSMNLVTVGAGKAAPLASPQPYAIARTFLGGSPNPTTSVASIQFGVERRTQVALEIYNVAGQRIRSLFAGNVEAGVYSREWDGRDEQGQDVATGVYIAKLQAGEKVITQKLVLAK